MRSESGFLKKITHWTFKSRRLKKWFQRVPALLFLCLIKSFHFSHFNNISILHHFVKVCLAGAGGRARSKITQIGPFLQQLPPRLSVLLHDLTAWVPSPPPRKTNRGPIGEVDWVEVRNDWSRGDSTSWHGCAPPAVTRLSEFDNNSSNYNEIKMSLQLSRFFNAQSQWNCEGPSCFHSPL